MTFVSWLAEQEGVVVLPAGANHPFLMDDATAAWVVVDGHVDVFLVSAPGGVVEGGRRPLLGIDAPALACGAASGDGCTLLAVGAPDSRLVRLDRARLRKMVADAAHGAEARNLLEGWLGALGESLHPTQPPSNATVLAAGPVTDVPAAGRVTPAGDVAWLACEGGPFLYEGTTEVSGVMPLPRRSWLEAREAGRLRDAGGDLDEAAWRGLDTALVLAMETGALLLQRRREREVRDLAQRTASESALVDVAVADLTSVLRVRESPPMPVDAAMDPLLAAVELVASDMGIGVRRPAQSDSEMLDPLTRIAQASRFRFREVVLEDGWWRKDSGPLLGFLADGNRPVALLQRGSSRYEMIDASTRRRTMVTSAVAKQLIAQAFMLYRPLPERPLKPVDLLRFGLAVAGRDATVIFLVGLASGILGLLTPIGTGLLVGTIIPTAQRSSLVDLGVGLGVAALATGLYNLTRALTVLHMQGKMDGLIQAAVMDRLINLPAPFFRGYTTGDLANRALGINSIRNALSGATVSSLLGLSFSVFSFAVLFYYDWQLALLATALVGFLVSVVLLTAWAQVKIQRQLLDLKGRIAGLVLQIILGVAKLRVAGAESAAFTQWAERYTRQQTLSLRVGLLSLNLASFGAGFQVLAQLCIFAFVAWRGYSRLSTGDFLAFNSAFGQFVGAVLGVTGAMASLLLVTPLLQRISPVLEAVPEVLADRPDPGELRGAVEVSHVSFRYGEGGNAVLEDVSLRAGPGEFIAIVGPSGAGKSTLLRLLLGFDAPQQGGVYYDGQDLRGVNAQAVRRQIGVVLQESNLMPGDLFSNIVGSTQLTMDDAWEAARIAGIADDIHAMPMGMHTFMMEGSTTISGGQRQRLMIARAVVTKPRMLFFDEATSALDSDTQEQVTTALERLNATRIVIAHRLSTIRNAHRIYVLSDHRIVQEGTFAELMAVPGEFQDLARRQLL